MGLPISAYIAAACLLAVASCELPVFQDVNLPCYRLTAKTVTPTKYEVDLSFSSLDSDFYEGQVNISLKLGKADQDQTHLPEKTCTTRGTLDEIVLHADESLEIHDIQLTNQFMTWHRNRTIKELSRDREKQMIKIKLERKLSRYTKAMLSIRFRGHMRDDKHGIYVSQYNDGFDVYKHIVAQFQPTFARTAFPCFDEPRFRVPFELTLHHPSGLTAYSNTNGRYEPKDTKATTKFERSPAIPLHMVAFTVGQFDKPRCQIKGNRTANPVTVCIITAPDENFTGYFARSVAIQSLSWFESYIDYPFPMDKLDIIAIADLDKDNAESWGLAFIRDTNLWIDDETKEETRITTAVNVAHVVVHQWFGNLISVAEWQDIWITEGVAAQMAFKFVEEFVLWESVFFVRIGILSSVMQADQTGKMHALSPPEEDLLTSSQIYGIFDTLEFMKSASFAQMVSESLGESEYKRRLQQLVAEYAHRTIFHDAYMRKIPECRELTSFVHRPGLPLVDVSKSGNSLHFLVESHNTADEIFGPLSRPLPRKIYTNAVFFLDERCRYNENHFISNNSRISAPEWFLRNRFKDRVFFKLSSRLSISAFFRTRYSDDLFQMLVNAVSKKSYLVGDKPIVSMDLVQLLDDANNLIQAGLMKHESFANLVAACSSINMGSQGDGAVLIQLLKVNKTLTSLGLESPLGRTFMEVFKKFGFNEPFRGTSLDRRALQDILKALVAQQEETVVMAALEAFKKSSKYGGKVAVFLREPVYAAVVQAGEKEQVQLLLKKLRNTQSYEEKIRLVTALAGSKDKRILTSVQNWLKSSGLKGETIKPFQDQMTATLQN